MSKYNLVKPANQVLNKIADVVSEEELLSPTVQEVIDRMLEIAAGKGKGEDDSRQVVGLAAPQIGVSKRIMIMDITASGANQEQSLCVFINPRITHASKEIVPGREGCWSNGTICGNVERFKEVTLVGLDRDGRHVSMKLTDFPARIAQHETDHLEGIRFPDRIPIDKPERLHVVEHADFEEYRKNWATWPNVCPRERWEAMKAGLLKLPD